ncbi:MAG: hypothetical protein D6795_05415, partial [Deltaproteobacteria bacterium]
MELSIRNTVNQGEGISSFSPVRKEMQTMATTLKVGDPAPDFTLPSNLDREISLSEFRGTKKVLLIFYPLDFSPVCSVQLPDYQKRIDAFPEDVQLLGISRDSVFS